VEDGVSPVSAYEAPEEVARSTDGVQLPAHRKMLYPARPGPEASVDDAHASEMVEVPVAVAASEAGVVGGVASTVTVVVAVEVPFAFVAVRVYVVVDVGWTMKDPVSVEVENAPGVIATELAFVTLKASVEVPAASTREEDAVKEAIEGVAALAVVVVATEEVAELSPNVSYAETV
jgi:hypothetical protein